MKAVIFALLAFAVFFAFAVESEKAFLEFVAKNKARLHAGRVAFKACRESTTGDKKAFLACLSEKLLNRAVPSDDTESDDQVLNEFFTNADESVEEQTMSDSDRSTNTAGVNLVKSFEGFRSCVYKDAVGLPTIGYGHLIKAGEKFTCISQGEAENLLRADLRNAESCVERSVRRAITDNQFAALASFAFNLGCGNLQSSTLLKKVNANAPISEICYEFSRWNKAGGKELAGLTRRRQAECDLYKA